MRALNTSSENMQPISAIKQEIADNIGKRIVIKDINKQSHKLVKEYEGTIISATKNIFLVSVDNLRLKQNRSFAYSDLSIGLLNYKIED